MSDLNELAYAFGRVNANLHRSLRLAVRVTGLEAEGVMKAQTPVDTGTMRNSTTVTFSSMGEVAEVGPTVNYAGYVVYGTRRRRPNPVDLRTIQVMGPRFEQRCEAVVEGVLA